MRTCTALAAASWLLVAGPISVLAEEKPEFRGVWITRFEWTSPDAEKAKANITHEFEALAAANFNAAVFQIRGAADTLYPSKLEPWSLHLGGKDPGFDPAAFAIQEAHRQGIAFHAYINAMPMLEPRWDVSRLDPNHLFNRHGPKSAEPWVVVDREGRSDSQEYYWMSPGIPAVPVYVRNVIMDVVKRYDVDGIHLDRIRYPGPEVSWDAVSRQRFLGRGNPNLLDFPDWQREQLNKFINDLSAEMRAEKPRVMFSCSAWGIYNRHNIEGYSGFSSGYHDYFQDTWAWCRLGAMDVLMPMIYWNMPEPKPNYDELVRDFAKGVGADHLVGGQRLFGGDENINEIRITREAGALGTVLFSFGSAQRRATLEQAHKALYQEKVPNPVIPRLAHPEYGTVLGTVQAEDGQPLLDAWLSIKLAGSGDAKAAVFSKVWTSAADGRFAFVNVPPGPVQIVANYEGAPVVTSEPVEVKVGEVANVQITIRGAAELRDKPYVAILRPRDGSSTTNETVHLLGRTTPKCSVTVNTQKVEVYPTTGGFAKDDIPLQPGENKIEITATEGERSVTRTIKVTRTAPTSEPAPEVKTVKVVEPERDVALVPGELLEIRLEGPSGRSGEAVLFDGQTKLPLAEAADKDGHGTGNYTAAMRVPASVIGRKSRVKVTLQASGDSGVLESESAGGVEVWDPSTVRIVETTSDETGITAGLHSVRLGGPWLAFVPKGTRMEVIGKRGEMCKVRLSPSITGWVWGRSLHWLPPGTPVPHNYFTSCDIQGTDGEETVSVHRGDPVAFAVRPETSPTNRIYVDMYNTHHAATWISHKSSAELLGPVDVQQIEDDCVRLTVPVKSKQIWGYWTEVKDGTLTLHVKRPPTIAAKPDSPLKGLTIAVEAGHGGSGSGAMGHMGTKEKTVNAEASAALQRELEARGAKVVQVRRRDEDPGLMERAARANEAKADFLISMHSNAAGNGRGFLKISGTSTYYYGMNGQAAAELVYGKLLELGWGEFGVVGNFSYAPLRNTRTPGILVEQAFMSNPADEARLIDPEYQRKQAAAIANGMEAFLDRVRE